MSALLHCIGFSNFLCNLVPHLVHPFQIGSVGDPLPLFIQQLWLATVLATFIQINLQRFSVDIFHRPTLAEVSLGRLTSI